MRRLAHVKDGVVENVSVWDGEYQHPVEEGVTRVEVTGEPVGPGWTYDGERFIAPAKTEEDED